MLNLPVHGPPRPRPAPPLLRAAPVRREPLGPHRHQLSHRRAAGRHLPARPRPCLAAATRVDLEAFLADLLARRTASTAATYQTVLKILYGWLAEDEETPTSPILSADSSPAKASILVPREDLNLGSPASHAGAVPPELQGQGVVLVETRGSNLRPHAASVAPSRLSYVPVWLVWCRDQESTCTAGGHGFADRSPRRWGVSAWVEPGGPARFGPAEFLNWWAERDSA